MAAANLRIVVLLAVPALPRRLARRCNDSLLLVALLCAALLAGAACDSRAREIRARLSDEELLLFDRGQKVSSPCWACHDFYGEQNKVGPYLSGVFGRQAAAAAFPGYSDAMRRSGIVWSRSTLARFLAAPQSVVPGTNMVAPGVGGADLQALLFYMERVTAAP